MVLIQIVMYPLGVVPETGITKVKEQVNQNPKPENFIKVNMLFGAARER